MPFMNDMFVVGAIILQELPRKMCTFFAGNLRSLPTQEMPHKSLTKFLTIPLHYTNYYNAMYTRLIFFLSFHETRQELRYMASCI